MKRIRTEMWAVTYKGRLYKNKHGMYLMFPTKKAAQDFTSDADAGTVKVTLTITPKDKP